MAEQLLALYAERKTVTGHAFPTDTTWQREFEDAFEFQETPDQQRAIEDVKRDMESPLPMDRLLCGDVGYGKTEVVMRAAFKALADSKQVAVLAPTTVLAFQHLETFRRRFAAFPMRIEMLSRFRTEKEQKKTLEELEAGKVDIVIGTHRLLSRDVKFQDLGLLVVDEEQRFGVAHKERLKEMRKNVDVLTMSATPIPRTLHMSLVGLRDMSLIETPPKDRLAIQTTVAPFSETLVQRVIEEEMARNGQVFFVHNRVESIASLASMVKRLVPRARVVVGHGQMHESDLEKVMMKFIRERPGHPTRQYHPYKSRRPHGALRAVSASRSGWPLEPTRLRVLACPHGRNSHIDRPPTPGCAQGIQRSGRGFSHCRFGSRIARGGEPPGPRAARPHRSGWLRYVLPDDGARGFRAKGRIGDSRAPGHSQPGAGYPHPVGVHRERKPASADL
jgi:hypothetical protein